MLQHKTSTMYSTPWMSDIVVGTMRWGAFSVALNCEQWYQVYQAAIGFILP